MRVEGLSGPRVLAGIPANLELTVYDEGVIGTPTSPTVAVFDALGVAVPAVASVTGAVLSATITAADNARPRVYHSTWTFTQGGTSYTVQTVHESVGEMLFTEAEARSYDDLGLADRVKYPADAILRVRDQIHDQFEDIAGVALGSRWQRDIVNGDGSHTLGVTRRPVNRVISINERAKGGAAVTPYAPADIDDIYVVSPSWLARETLGIFTLGIRNLIVEYEAGFSPIPLDLRRAALRLARYLLVPSDIDDRTMSTTNQFGNARLAVAGLRDGAWFGIPPVDSTLQFYRDRYKIPSFA